MTAEWLIPWYGVEDDPQMRAGHEAQLAREVGPRHVLRGIPGQLLARRQDNDDCLFLLPDGRVAYVHLTWRQSEEPDPRWPNTGIYGSLEEWVEEVMRSDHADWVEDNPEDA